MRNFGVIDSLASDIEVNWTSGAGVEYGHRYPTRSVTARTRSGKLYEYFGFNSLCDFKLTFKGESSNVNIEMLYKYVPGISDKDYPDGLETENYYIGNLKELAITSNITVNNYSWDWLNKEVCKRMLGKYNEMQEIESQLEIGSTKLSESDKSIIDLKRTR